MIDSVVSVSAFAEKPIRAELDRMFELRNAALEKCYSIPGFTTLSRKAGNKIYDHVKAKIAEQMEAASNEQA